MASLLSMAGLIACKDASLFHAFLCSRPPPSVFYKLLEIERAILVAEDSEDNQILIEAYLRPP